MFTNLHIYSDKWNSSSWRKLMDVIEQWFGVLSFYTQCHMNLSEEPLPAHRHWSLFPSMLYRFRAIISYSQSLMNDGDTKQKLLNRYQKNPSCCVTFNIASDFAYISWLLIDLISMTDVSSSGFLPIFEDRIIPFGDWRAQNRIFFPVSSRKIISTHLLQKLHTPSNSTMLSISSEFDPKFLPRKLWELSAPRVAEGESDWTPDWRPQPGSIMPIAHRKMHTVELRISFRLRLLSTIANAAHASVRNTVQRNFQCGNTVRSIYPCTELRMESVKINPR